MFSCLPSGDSGSFLLFPADDNSSCRRSELEKLPVGLGINLYGSFSFTSGEGVEDGIEGKPELELLVELAGDGTLEVESDGKLEGGEGVHLSSFCCSIIQFCG